MVRPRTHGVAIRIFLTDGTPQGLRIVERMGWTGVCLAFARPDYQTVRARDEVARTGVYILTGPDVDGEKNVRMYIGEGESVRVRLDQHQREKDFWTEAYVLTTTDNSLNKAQVRYLEARLIELAREAGVASLDNGTAPPLTWLSEPDVAVMDSYLDYALAILPLLGVTVFDLIEPAGTRGPSVIGSGDAHVLSTISAPIPLEAETPLYLHTVQTDAEGRDDPRGFIVYEGATSRKKQNVMARPYEALRHRLILDGTLSDHNADQYVLTRNFLFDSPSAAASVLAGGSKNGRTEWKDGGGITLKELQEQTVQFPVDLIAKVPDIDESEGYVPA